MSTTTEQQAETIRLELCNFAEAMVGGARQAGIIAPFRLLVPENIIWAAGLKPSDNNYINANGERVAITPHPTPHGMGPYNAALAYDPQL